MLSSRDTPFDEDGFALVLEDLKRLSLLVGGGSNDLNAGAVDADQEAFQELTTALSAHEIDPDAHPELDNRYLRISAYTAYSPYYVTSQGSSITTQNATGSLDQLTTAVIDATGTGSLSLASGVFTAPATGLYLITATIAAGGVSVSATGTTVCVGRVRVTGSIDEISEFNTMQTVAFPNTPTISGVVGGAFSMASGDTAKFYAQFTHSGGTGVTPKLWTQKVSIVRLL